MHSTVKLYRREQAIMTRIASAIAIVEEGGSLVVEVPVLNPKEAAEMLGDIRVLTIQELGNWLGVPNQRWADERQWCHHAIAGERPATCPMFANDEDTPSGFCQLNGYSDPTERTPCVFDEPSDAEIWRKVTHWRRQRKEVEPCEDCWA
jgi:hypothetical protein